MNSERQERAEVKREQGVRLLTADPNLGQGLDPEQLAQARKHAILPVHELEKGPFEITSLNDAPGVRGTVFGFLIIEGALSINLQLSGRRCSRLMGSSEVVLMDGIEIESVPVAWTWAVVEPARLAILDDRLLMIGRHWPKLLSSILQRAAMQTMSGFLQQAISQMPRVEQRLLALLWSVADRHGVVRPDGVFVKLEVTHDMLANMVGAQRPTVSLGLRRLADEGLVKSETGGWLLHPDSSITLTPPTSV